jgi:hypothetical protein
VVVRLRKFGLLVVLGAMASGGCAESRTDVATPSPAATPMPTADVSELGVGEPTARATKGGLVVEFWLDRMSVPIGGRLNALARVSNDGPSTVMWETNTCSSGAAPMAVKRLGGAAPPPAVNDPVAEFRRQVLEPRDLVGGFIDTRVAGSTLTMACADFSALGRFAPADSEELVVAWDAVESREVWLSAGTHEVSATFTYWGLDQEGPPEQSEQLVATANIELTGETPQRPSFADYVDAALADQQFAGWLAEQPVNTWINPSWVFWPNREGEYPPQPYFKNATVGAFAIGLFVMEDGGEKFGEVILDVPTLKVLGHRFR